LITNSANALAPEARGQPAKFAAISTVVSKMAASPIRR
jgi:hypothetical protein